MISQQQWQRNGGGREEENKKMKKTLSKTLTSFSNKHNITVITKEEE